MVGKEGQAILKTPTTQWANGLLLVIVSVEWAVITSSFKSAKLPTAG